MGCEHCEDQALTNWERVELNPAQVHHLCARAWTPVFLLRALCSYGLRRPGEKPGEAGLEELLLQDPLVDRTAEERRKKLEPQWRRHEVLETLV